MNSHVKMLGLPEEVRALAVRYPALHKKFGDEVLSELFVRCSELGLESLNNVAERNPDIAAEVASLILGYRVERQDRSPKK